jgi:hypothetical protein
VFEAGWGVTTATAGPYLSRAWSSQLVRERAAAGESVPLADVASTVGLDPADYR